MRNISLFLILSFSISILGYVSKEILNIDDLLGTSIRVFETSTKISMDWLYVYTRNVIS